MNTRPHPPRRRGGATFVPARRQVPYRRRQPRRAPLQRLQPLQPLQPPSYHTSADGRSLAPPAAIDGAEWQPLVTPGADGLRPTLDGEPVPGALAASVTQGWVRIAPLDPLRSPKRGAVRLVPVSRPCR